MAPTPLRDQLSPLGRQIYDAVRAKHMAKNGTATTSAATPTPTTSSATATAVDKHKNAVSIGNATTAQTNGNLVDGVARTPDTPTAHDAPHPNSNGSASTKSETIANKHDTHSATNGPAEPLNTPSKPINTRGRGRGRGRGSRGSTSGRRTSRGSKRRRNEDEIRADDSPSDTDPEDLIVVKIEDDDAATTAATRSGRPVTKPTAFTTTDGNFPPIAAAGASGGVAAPSPIAGIKRKRQSMNRKNPELAVCKVCLRPHSPATNMIVFCDGCNTPFHRYCHHPPIAQEVVDVREMEWYCAECEADNELLYDVDTFVSGQGLSDEKKRAHMSKFPAPVLVDLLIRASNLHPDLPILPPSAMSNGNGSISNNNPAHLPTSSQSTAMAPPPRPRRQPTIPPHASFSIPPSRPPDPNAPVQRPPDDELEQLDDSNDPPACYVRPGFGLARLLRPESEDEGILVDDNHEVYAHVVQSDPRAANEALFGSGLATDGERNEEKGLAQGKG